MELRSTKWMDQSEGGGRFALWLIVRVALLFGRTLTRLVLYPITLYFLVRRAHERQASRTFLEQLHGRKVNWRDVFRHMFAFSSVTLDRVFLLTDAYRQFDIRAHGLEEVDRFLDAGKGIVMIGAHVGSFEALRIIAQQRPEQSVRPVIDLEQNPSVSRLLNALNPEMASSIINARRSGIETVLAIRDALAKRAIVTLMADRARPENTLVDADFLGRKIGLPIEPWLLASSLKAPVVLCFGLYRGGRRYELFFETFSDQLTIERAHRATQIRECVQRFAERLTHYVRLAPENWFNFYDMWSDGDGFSL